MDNSEPPECGPPIPRQAAKHDRPETPYELTLDLTVDLTGTPAAAHTFHVDDRVERLSSTTERSHWGTITSGVHLQDREDWLVVDNDGVTHQDAGDDLVLARRGQTRRHIPESKA